MANVTVTSDIRAVVLEIAVAVGDAVAAGQELVVLESMKTEIPVTASRDGTVAALLVNVGDEVAEQQPLATLST